MSEFRVDDLVTLPLKNIKELGDIQYKTAKIERIYFPSKTNIDERHFGGRVNKIAKLQNAPLYIIVDKDEKTIGKAMRKVDLDSLKDNSNKGTTQSTKSKTKK